ncbi:ATP-dependent RNA helicase DbpA [Pontiella sulfatireligans]|uniref:ATP-dependent RNA helicase DbpA n=1 Tax=Pontiella sulfatireligans TaxID=2750658 RepID=A0A6C2UKR2_9BACT|nr:ATP-dependent RNA helicase DbpA [Pontiella sulfatireligans]VGO19991.1 ATP-dependent RNA helicase DbpA [Pontiella sulfatireligans]
MNPRSFSNLPLSDAQLSNLESLNYHNMTPVQAAALPGALAGDDLIAQARTGSGKTAVFALAMLARLDVTSPATQVLVLCPTRELSIQVSTDLRRLARHQQNVTLTTLYGGQNVDLQKQSLKKGAHIVVGTPGRVADLVEKGVLVLRGLTMLVLDEADRMLDMGFIKELKQITRVLPSKRQTLLFSATFPENIQELSGHLQRDPKRITMDEPDALSDIEQHMYRCKPEDKLDGLKTLLLEHQPTAAVIFCNFKQSTLDIRAFLRNLGFSAVALNGDLDQRQREDILIQFKHQSCSVLIATDVAARGLDIKDLPVVINYELPLDPESYVHRIGRTGRAGKRGLALSLCSEREQRKVSEINAYQKSSLKLDPLEALRPKATKIPAPLHVTLSISGGRKAKVRAGDILGALTGEGGIEGSQVGKIDVMDFMAYVAVQRAVATRAEQKLSSSKIKGRSFKIKKL